MSSVQFEKYTDYEEMSQAAALIISEEIKQNPSLILCPATGSTPTRTYQMLAGHKQNFNDVRLLALDEWNLDRNNPASCYYYLTKTLIEPLGINKTIVFDISKTDEEIISESKDYIKSSGPIDLCILGIGQNGHLGFNEPGPFIEPYCHKADLSAESMQHAMIDSTDILPGYGLTLGMKDILSSKKIVLLISGKGKKTVTEKLLEGKITPGLPATFLWLHDKVNCLIEEDVFLEG